MRYIVNIILITLVSFGLAGLAEASGVSVTPGEVNIRTERGKTKGEVIRIKNPTTNVSLINVYPDEMEEIIRAIPSSFILEGGGEREVTIEARPREEGIIAGTLSVRAETLGSEDVGAGAGVKIPVRLEARASSPYLATIAGAFGKGGVWIVLVAGLLALAGILFGYGVRELKKT